MFYYSRTSGTKSTRTVISPAEFSTMTLKIEKWECVRTTRGIRFRGGDQIGVSQFDTYFELSGFLSVDFPGLT